jgi:hypothetical protein
MAYGPRLAQPAHMALLHVKNALSLHTIGVPGCRAKEPGLPRGLQCLEGFCNLKQEQHSSCCKGLGCVWRQAPTLNATAGMHLHGKMAARGVCRGSRGDLTSNPNGKHTCPRSARQR